MTPISWGNPDGASVSAQSEVIVPNPVAGADWSYVVPAGVSQRIDLAIAHFVASATVGNRVPAFNILNSGGNRLYRIGIPGNIAAGGGFDIEVISSQGTQATLSTAGALVVTIPPLWLPSGSSLVANTSGLDAADQWSNIHLIVEAR